MTYEQIREAVRAGLSSCCICCGRWFAPSDPRQGGSRVFCSHPDCQADRQ